MDGAHRLRRRAAGGAFVQRHALRASRAPAQSSGISSRRRASSQPITASWIRVQRRDNLGVRRARGACSRAARDLVGQLVFESDLRLGIDWSAFYWIPADVFGPGKVLVFGEVIDKNGGHYTADLRGALKAFAKEQFEKTLQIDPNNIRAKQNLDAVKGMLLHR